MGPRDTSRNIWLAGPGWSFTPVHTKPKVAATVHHHPCPPPLSCRCIPGPVFGSCYCCSAAHCAACLSVPVFYAGAGLCYARLLVTHLPKGLRYNHHHSTHFTSTHLTLPLPPPPSFLPLAPHLDPGLTPSPRFSQRRSLILSPFLASSPLLTILTPTPIRHNLLIHSLRHNSPIRLLGPLLTTPETVLTSMKGGVWPVMKRIVSFV